MIKLRLRKGKVLVQQIGRVKARGQTRVRLPLKSMFILPRSAEGKFKSWLRDNKEGRSWIKTEWKKKTREDGKEGRRKRRRKRVFVLLVKCFTLKAPSVFSFDALISNPVVLVEHVLLSSTFYRWDLERATDLPKVTYQFKSKAMTRIQTIQSGNNPIWGPLSMFETVGMNYMYVLGQILLLHWG